MPRAIFSCLVAVLTCTSAWGDQPRIDQSERRDRMFPELVVESLGRRATCDAIAFSSDGEHLLAVGDDKVVRVWDFHNGKVDPGSMKMLRWSVSGPLRGAIYALALPADPNDRRVAIGGLGMKSAAAAVIDRQTGEILSTIYAVDHVPEAEKKQGVPAVRAITFSPGGDRVVFGTEDGSVWLWPPKKNGKEELRRLGKHWSEPGKLNRVRLLHFLNETKLLSVAQKGDVIQWDFVGDESTSRRWKLFDQLEHRTIHDVCISPNKKWLAARAEQGAYVYLHSLDGKRRKIELPEDCKLVSGLAFDPSGRRLAVGLRFRSHKTNYDLWANDRIVLYDLSQDEPTVSAKRPHIGSVDVLAFHPKGKYLAVAGGDNHEVSLWDLSRQQKSPVVLRGVGSGIWNVALSKDDKYLAFQTQRDPAAKDPNQRGQGPWTVFDLSRQQWADAPNRFKPAPKLKEDEGWQVNPVKTKVWKVQNPGKGIYNHVLPWDPDLHGIPQCYAFLPRPEGAPVRLAVGHYHGVSIFELSETEAPRRIYWGMGHEGEVMSLAVSAKGDWLVSASDDQTIAAWSLDRLGGSELGARCELDKNGQIFVAKVDLFSPAWEAGLMEQDRIVQLAVRRERMWKRVYRQADAEGEDQPIGTANECLQTLASAGPDDPLAFRIKRGEKNSFDKANNLTRRPVWRFFPTKDKEWVLWMWGHHYYDCSTSGDKYIGWQLNNADPKKTPRFYEAEKFRDLFHNRNVINQLLDRRGKRLDASDLIREALKVKEEDEENSLRPPTFDKFDTVTVQIEPRDQTIKGDKDVEVTLVIEPQVQSPDYKPSRAELWINDHRLYVWKKLDGNGLREKFTIPSNRIRRGDNQLTLQCYNEVKGRGRGRLEVSSRIRCERVAQQRNLYGFVVGINDYSRSPDFGPKKSLNTPIRDMEAIREAWMKQQGGKLYAKVDIALLTDKNRKAFGPTIVKQFKELVKKAGPDDQVFVFLAGHGLAAEDKQGKMHFRFCCPDYDPRKPETSISARELYELMAKIPCRKVLFLDVCHSGQVARPLRDLTPGGRGPTILASCDVGQLSWEPRLANRAKDEDAPSGSSKAGDDSKPPPASNGTVQNSYFVTALLEAFESKDADRDGNGTLDAREIYDYTKKRVPHLLKEARLNRSQNPACFPDPDALERSDLLVQSAQARK